MNPAGMFSGGMRLREYSTVNDPLPMSGKLIPEFFGRRNIRDMFTRKSSLQASQHCSVTINESKVSNTETITGAIADKELRVADQNTQATISPAAFDTKSSLTLLGKKRSANEASLSKNSKRAKSLNATVKHSPIGKGQQSLKGFFKPDAVASTDVVNVINEQKSQEAIVPNQSLRLDAPLQVESSPTKTPLPVESSDHFSSTDAQSRQNSPSSAPRSNSVHDPVESKESWSKLFTKPAAPRCEGHDEACITLVTKKPGMNLGRSFWMCPRPLGPSGAKEKNTQWRCQTFIWCSDWNPNVEQGV